MRRARIGSRRHGCDIGRLEDEDSSRTRAAAAGRYVKDDRDLRVRDLVDDVAGRFDESSGRIDLDQYGLIVAALSLVDGAGNVFLGDGLNRIVDNNLQNLGAGDGAEEKSPSQSEKNVRNPSALHCTPRFITDCASQIQMRIGP